MNTRLNSKAIGAKIWENVQAHRLLHVASLPSRSKNTFQVIVSDPPWSFDDGLKKMKSRTKRSAISQYSTLSTAELCQLSVQDLVDANGSVLVLWVPSTLLEHGLEVMKAWGFKLKQTFVWVKTKKKTKKVLEPNDNLAFGMGRLFRQCHEIALIGTTGKSIYPLLENNSQRSVTLDQNDGHSKKPESLQDRLDIMFPKAAKLEMFARRNRNGWTCVGNGIDGKDMVDAIHELRDGVKEEEENEIQAV